jgi:hypothetical protein
VIREPNEYLEISAKYDTFIDLHLVFSKHASNSLTKDFGVRREKIYLCSQPHSNANDFSTVLMSL